MFKRLFSFNHPVKERLFRGAGAQFYARIVQFIIRFAEVPLLLSFWGPRLYGEWLMLVAIPSYLSIGDGGFSTAACREMAMRAGAGKRDEVLSIFQSTWVLLLVLSLAIGLGSFLFVETAPLARWLGFEKISPSELRFILMCLVAFVLVGFQGGLLNGGYWVAGRYPLGMFFSATSSLLQFVGLAVAVVLGGGPVAAALGYLCGRIAGVLLIWAGSRRVTPWLRHGFRYAGIKKMKYLARPAFASLAFPLGNALNSEGMRLLVGILLGPASVAVFVPLRTLSRLATQPRAMINLLIEPEMALAYGNGDADLFVKLFNRSCQLALWSVLVLAIFLGASGSLILKHWAAGKIAMHWGLFTFLLASVVVNATWYTALLVMYATNRHGRAAVKYAVVFGGGAFLLAYAGIHFLGFTGVGVALLTTEGIMAFLVVSEALKMTGEPWHEWVKTVLTPPWFLLKQVRKNLMLA